MADFIFNLQSVLNLKQQIEDSLKNELGKAVRKLEHEKEVARRLECEKDDCINRFYRETAQGVAVDKLKEYNAYISGLNQKIKVQKENVNYAGHNVDKYREQLVAALQERQMLEKLKEKKYQEYLKEELKREQAINDEIVSFNYNGKVTGDENG